MALNFANNNSLSAITTLPASISGGAMTLISEQTASSSASLEFSLDDSYDSYVFKFINIHAGTDRALFQFQGSTDNGSNYNTTATTTYFQAYHTQDDSSTELAYNETHDDAQTTGFMNLITHSNAEDNEASASGTLQIYNPSSSVFVKHFISSFNHIYETDPANNPYSWNSFKGGYFNTTSPVTNLKFQFSSGNIDSGVIKLYGIS